jgi:hypothetical protein
MNTAQARKALRDTRSQAVRMENERHKAVMESLRSAQSSASKAVSSAPASSSSFDYSKVGMYAPAPHKASDLGNIPMYGGYAPLAPSFEEEKYNIPVAPSAPLLLPIKGSPQYKANMKQVAEYGKLDKVVFKTRMDMQDAKSEKDATSALKKLQNAIQSAAKRGLDVRSYLESSTEFQNFIGARFKAPGFLERTLGGIIDFQS